MLFMVRTFFSVVAGLYNLISSADNNLTWPTVVVVVKRVLNPGGQKKSDLDTNKRNQKHFNQKKMNGRREPFCKSDN